MSLKMDDVAAVVLAGGFGTRVRHLLADLPKPMAPVAGRPFLEWVLRYLSKQDVKRIVLSTGYHSEVVEKHFETQPVAGLRVRCVPETEPLGTAGGFLHAVHGSGEKPRAWFVLNGDSLVFADLAATVAVLADPKCSGVIVGRAVTDAARYGTLAVGPSGKLLRFEEKRPGRGVINSGIYLLRNSVLERFPKQSPLSFEKDVFPSLLAEGAAIKVLSTE